MKNRSSSSIKNNLSVKPYWRPLAHSERLYIASARVMPPFCNRMVFEGTGVPDINLFRSAVEKASEANPDSRLVLKGVFGGCYWEDSGQTPPVIEVDGSSWSGYDSANIPLPVDNSFDPSSGPTCDVIIVYGDPVRIVFRTLHAVMDGQGTMLWIKNIFRALRGEELIKTNSSITDYELIESIQQKEKRKYFYSDCTSPTGKTKGKQTDIIWYRKKITGNQKGLVSKCAEIISREIWKTNVTHARFMIPVDMRGHDKTLNSTANLSNPLYIELSPGSTGKDVYGDIKTQLQKHREAMTGMFDYLIRFIPIWMIVLIVKSTMKVQDFFNRYWLTGIISHMGFIDLKDCSGGGFHPVSAFLMQPHTSAVPFFLGIFNTADHIELTGCIARNLGSDGRLETLMNKIADDLESKE